MKNLSQEPRIERIADIIHRGEHIIMITTLQNRLFLQAR